VLYRQNSGKATGSICVVCLENPTCEAHIIPRAFVREIKKSNNHVLQLGVTGSRKAKRPMGLADYNILCSECDGIIGQVDKYAIEFTRNFQVRAGLNPYSIIKFEGMETDKIRIFALSVVWKSSVSSLEFFNHINLGPYEMLARGLIFDGHDLDGCTNLHVQINALTSTPGDASSFISYPLRARNENGPYFIFSAGGFQFLVRFGSRPFFSGQQLQWANQLAIRSDQTPIGVVYPFEESGEFETVKLARNADLVRKRGSR
jgi:hypothetical protein